MNDMKDLVEKFYASFAKKDYRGMAECYHPDAVFQDEVFSLKGKEIHAMWHMLCETGRDFALTYRDVKGDAEGGSAHWDATYTFSRTGQKVLNRIDATFEFRDGKIISHRDRFDFWAWSRQSLGFKGLLLGWTPIVHAAIRKGGRENLDKFLAKHPEYR